MDNAAQINESLRKACIICQKEYSGELTICPIDNIALTVLEVPRDPLVGTLFCDRFQITEVLGGGGMGMVYRATHLMMQRSVAIKILHTKMVGNADALKRFKVEAHAASNFSHPNILNVHDFGVSNQGQPYMVMDYLEGINLTALLDAEKYIPVARAINMFLQMSSALAHAHSKEIIHRDVKPSNIMLVEFEGRREFVKLVDFGIAKVLNPSTPEAENLTRTGEVFGSPLYMSPEQCQGKKLDSRADIYSLGAVMYRVVSGKPIFESTDALETMFRQVSEMPASFSKVCPEIQIPEKLEAVIFKCLAKEREQRYQSMLELKDDLELTAAEIKAQSKTTLPMNTLPLESERIAAKDLNSDGWLTDLSENTGALPIAKTVITNQLTSPHANAPANSNAPSAGVQNTVPVSPFADVVSSADAAGALNASGSQSAKPSVASVNTGSNNFSFSLNSNVGPSVAGNTNPPPASPSPTKSTVIDKRDETISIVVNKKSIAIGSAALAVLLALAGFFYFRPSGTSANLSPKNVPDSQFSSITPTPTIDGAHLTPPIPAPAQTVAKKSTPSSKKSASHKKATAKNKPQQQKWKNYYPSASGRGSSYSGSNYSSPSSNPYSSSSSYSSSRSSSSYSYQPSVSQPVIQSAPVVAPVAPPIQSSVSSSNYSSSSESYVNRRANRYAEKGVERVSGFINRNLNKGVRKGAGWVRKFIP